MYDVVMANKRSVIVSRIEELLRIRGMSVADLSRASGITESALSNILSGNRKQPRSDTVQKLAKGLATSTDYLNGYTSNPEPVDGPEFPTYAAEVLASMRKLDKTRNFELLVFAKGLVSANEELRKLTRDELANELLDQIKEMIFNAADSAGRSEELNRFLEEQIQKLKGEANEDEDHDTGSGDEPPQ